MSTLNRKFSFDDFVDFAAIDSLWQKDITIDSEGYTPIGAAILNGATPECVAYLMQLYTFNGSQSSSSYSKSNPYRDIATDKSKGKSPLEIACMVMNASLAEVLISDHYVYQIKDKDGNLVPKINCYGDPLVDTDKDGKITAEYFTYSSVPLWEKYTEESYKYNKIGEIEDFPECLRYKKCECLNSDILAAAALPKSDILKKLVKEEQQDLSFYDQLGNTPILLACAAGCYDSVDLLLEKDTKVSESVFKTNSSKAGEVSAYDVAEASNDQILIDKLDNAVDLQSALEAHFASGNYNAINSILITRITSDNIYSYLINDEYSLSDGSKITIAKYIDDSKNENLYSLLLPNYNKNSFITIFATGSLYNIIAYLYNHSYIEIDDIISDELDSATQCDIVNYLYDQNHIKLSDIYYIYDNYNSTLSYLNDDLKPLIGKMKYGSENILSSYFFWSYNFTVNSVTRWSLPQYYQNNVIPVIINSLESVPGDTYSLVKITDGNTTHIPSSFRLDTVDSKPAFYLDYNDNFLATPDNNGMIVSFNLSTVRYKFTLPQDLYSIESSYLGSDQTYTIEWNHDHILYDLLADEACYSVEDINHKPIAVVNNSSITINAGDSIVLDASSSSDPDEDYITFNWTGDHLDWLNSANSSTPTLTAPSDLESQVTTIFTVTVTDGRGMYDSKSVDVTVEPAPIYNTDPVVVVAQSLVTGYPGSIVTLDASDSYDPDGDVITFNWTGVYASQLASTTSSVTQFTIPDNAEPDDTYTFTVTVTDSNNASSFNTVTIKALAVPSIGKFAFESGLFTVSLINSTDKMCSENNTLTTVQDAWRSVYSDGYTVQQVPKSPNSNPFTYNLLYSEDI